MRSRPLLLHSVQVITAMLAGAGTATILVWETPLPFWFAAVLGGALGWSPHQQAHLTPLMTLSCLAAVTFAVALVGVVVAYWIRRQSWATSATLVASYAVAICSVPVVRMSIPYPGLSIVTFLNVASVILLVLSFFLWTTCNNSRKSGLVGASLTMAGLLVIVYFYFQPYLV